MKLVNIKGLACLENCILTAMCSLNLEYTLQYRMLLSFNYSSRPKDDLTLRIGRGFTVHPETILTDCGKIGFYYEHVQSSARDVLRRFSTKHNEFYLIVNSKTGYCPWSPFYKKEYQNHCFIIYDCHDGIVYCADPFFDVPSYQISLAEILDENRFQIRFQAISGKKEPINYLHLLESAFNQINYNEFIKNIMDFFDDIRTLDDINHEYVDDYYNTPWRSILDMRLMRISNTRSLYCEFIDLVIDKEHHYELRPVQKEYQSLSNKWMGVQKSLIKWFLTQDKSFKEVLLYRLDQTIQYEIGILQNLVNFRRNIMAIIGNVPEINHIKSLLDEMVQKKYIRQWELPYESILTRLSAAIFFVTATETKWYAKIWEELQEIPNFKYESNGEKAMSKLEYKVTFPEDLSNA